MTSRAEIISCLMLIVAEMPALAGPPEDYGFDFVTIGAVGNQPILNSPSELTQGRGGVDYRYRIARREVTTAQWLEFVNTFAIDDSLWNNDLGMFVRGPTIFWGAEVDLFYGGPGRQYRLIDYPGAADMQVCGMTWMHAAMYCNWLNNGKPSSWDAIQSGVYDAADLQTENGYFTTIPEPAPESRFRLPTMDEWLKAVHYDPNRYGPGQEGWWMYPNASDTPLIPGVPGEGQTTAGLDLEFELEFAIPLGAYPDVVTPWGLLDASGGASEWTGVLPDGYALFDGAGTGNLGLGADVWWGVGGTSPWDSGVGLRLVSAVPSPHTVAGFLVAGSLVFSNRRRR